MNRIQGGGDLRKPCVEQGRVRQKRPAVVVRPSQAQGAAGEIGHDDIGLAVMDAAIDCGHAMRERPFEKLAAVPLEPFKRLG
jgi:hypothetical protein